MRIPPSQPDFTAAAPGSAAQFGAARFSSKPAQASDRVLFGGAPEKPDVEKEVKKKGYHEPSHLKPTRRFFQWFIPSSGVAAVVLTAVFPPAGIPVLLAWAAGSGLAIKDMTQKEHSLLRTYAIKGRGRALMEKIAPEIKQYFVERDTDEVPLSPLQRRLVYARSKGQNDKQAMGTLHDLYKMGTEWLMHSGRPKLTGEVINEPRITIGGPDCKQPYEASIFNTSGMSFGSLSAQAVMALSKGAYLDNFFVNTGEGGLSPFHLGFNVNIEDPNFDMDKILDEARKPITDEDMAEARKSGKWGVIEKGFAKLIPLSEEEQLKAIQEGREEHLRNRIKEGLAEIKDDVLNPYGIEAKDLEQTIFEAYKAIQGGHDKELPAAVKGFIAPVLVWLAQKEFAAQQAESKKGDQVETVNGRRSLSVTPAGPELDAAQKVLANLVAEESGDQQQRVVSKDEQDAVNTNILARGIGRILRIKNPEKLKKGVPGKILKGTAEHLRLNTMQFSRFPGGDIVWNIGTGYFGCRNADGTFNPKEFEKRATLPQVKMIELKLSQGAKPGGGGILPGDKVTPGIARMRGVKAGEDCVSPSRHSSFGTPVEMLQQLKKMRDLSGGKPVGFKLCIGQPYEFLAYCKAMQETGITPDFITVDGAEGGTGAAPPPMSDNSGMPLKDAINLVHNALIGAGLRDKIKVIASGKVVDEFDIISNIARGADACNSARSMMLSIGCIMARICHTGKCPVGVATQDPELAAGLDPDDKGLRNAMYHRVTLKELRHMLGSAGLTSTQEITPDFIMERTGKNSTRRLSKILPRLENKALIDNKLPAVLPEHLQDIAEEWDAADPHSYMPRPGSDLSNRITADRELRLGQPEEEVAPAPTDDDDTPPPTT